ncbi:hypothetical protein V8C26DRAFT_98643 [Trichoderma gracile]
MSVYSALLLAAAGFAAADKLAAMNLVTASDRNITVAGPGAASFGVHSVSDGCGIGMTTCDVNCMPLTGICCGLGNGAYCDIGYSCVDDGCCPVGKICNGPPTGCNGDRDLCGEFCVPKGTCDGSGGSGGGSGGSGGSGECPSGYEACDDECMPTGSVCCHNGYHCNAGQTCTSDFKCRLGGSGGGGGGSSGGDGDDDPTSTIDDSFTTRGSGGSRPTSYSLSPDPEPTAAPTESNPFGGDDVSSTEDSQPTATEPSTTPRPTSNRGSGGSSGGSNGGSSGSEDDGDDNGGSSGSNGNSNNGNGKSGSSSGDSNGDSEDDGSSGTMNAPSLVAGFLALAAFVL